jgi:beta-glucanase (GH16 family)
MRIQRLDPIATVSTSYSYVSIEATLTFKTLVSLTSVVLSTLPSSAAEIAAPQVSICSDTENTITDELISEDFSLPVLDPCTWVVVQANWGGQQNGHDYNGGVLAENVSVRDGLLVLRAHGNAYRGPSRGINLDGSVRRDGKRTGAAIMTRQRYQGGRFEARFRAIKRPGAVSALWTFFYDQSAEGVIRNHEIDIEFPGQAHDEAPISFRSATLTTWTGLQPGQTTAAFAAVFHKLIDSDLHILRFDWRPKTLAWSGAVSFYIDGRLKHVTRHNVPSEPGNVWLGAWFPPVWAGEPEFDEAEMIVDWVHIIPLASGN